VAELRRELGRWDLTAIGINQVIGGAVFALPAGLAALAGGWSPYLVVAVGVASLMIAATFAEVASRFDATGGPYLYTKTAFGRFPAFEIGWMLWFTRVASWASVINVLVASLGFYWPVVAAGAPRTALITAIITTLAGINIVGIRQSAWAVNALTIGKLVPLTLFVAFGLPAVETSSLTAGSLPSASQLSAAALLLIFTYGGYEVIPVPAGESKDPRRGVPFALITTIGVVTVVFALVQIVAMGTLANLTPSSPRWATTWDRRCRDRGISTRSQSRAICLACSASSAPASVRRSSPSCSRRRCRSCWRRRDRS
jgi:basic amino acid/polyamine antiporter, APA family